MIFKTLLLSAVAATFTATATAQTSTVVDNVNSLNTSKTYLITNGRGGIITTGTDATECSLDAKATDDTSDPSTDDNNNLWVFVKSSLNESTYYIYNVGAQKFLYPATDGTASLSSTVDCSTQRFTITKDAKNEDLYGVSGTYNFQIVPVAYPAKCFAISNAFSKKFGFGVTTTYGKDAGGRFNFTEVGTFDNTSLSTVNGAITTAENTLINALSTTISNIKKAIGNNAGTIGYPTTAAYSAFTTAVDATDANYETKSTAVSTLLSKANMTLPTDGKAYYIHPVNKGASSKTVYYLYTNADGKLHFTTSAQSSAIFYAHKVGEKFIFTNSAGKYMTFRADGQPIGGQSNGALSDYAACCQFTLLPFNFSGTGDNCSISSITSMSADYLGLLLIQGAMTGAATNSTSDLHYLMANTSQTTNDNPFHNGPEANIYYTASGNTCAYYFEEASQENAFKATEMKVGEETLYLGSYSSPFPVVLPKGLTAYKVSQAGETATLSPIDGQVIPAATGVIIKADDATQAIPTARTTEDIPTVDNNKLVASTGTAVETSVNAFILGCDNTTKAANFYKLNSSDRTVKLYKAYLDLTSASANKLSLNFGGVISGIQSAATGETTQAKAVYDLSGRRVNKPAHGFYIVNGKKTLVK